MKHKILLFSYIIFSSVCFTSQAQNRISPVTYYGTVMSHGKGIPNVPVTDGMQIVLTDTKGKYSIQSTNVTEYVYITIPKGFDIPIKDNRPAFYKKVSDNLTKKERIDFELVHSTHSDKRHIMIVWADPQVYFDEEMPQVREAAIDVKQLIKSNYSDMPVYGIVCGDIIGNINKKPSYFPAMIDTIAKAKIPFFYVIGNHDMNMDARSNEGTRITYKSYFGPTYYSFNRGDIHYIVLDDIFSIAKSYLYVGYLTEQQLQWLEQDLKQVQKGATVVVATHIPTYSREARHKEWSKESTMKVMNNRATLYELLKPYNAHIFSGHEHYNENYILSDSLYEHVHAPLSTLFWQAPWACDGTPGGYGVYEFDGSTVRWYYKSIGKDKSYQFELYPMGKNPDKENAIVANVWNYDDTWKVKWFENGIDRGEMIRYTGYDANIYNYCAENKSKFKHKYLGAGQTEHLFYAIPLISGSDIKVCVTDHCGNTYTRELKQTK